MQSQTPFSAELYNGRIILSGDMDRATRVGEECERVAKLAARAGPRFIVDAQSVKLYVGGDNVWSTAAQKFLGHCNLVYLPSQLALNLQYDDEYRHNKSQFLDTDDELVD